VCICEPPPHKCTQLPLSHSDSRGGLVDGGLALLVKVAWLRDDAERRGQLLAQLGDRDLERLGLGGIREVADDAAARLVRGEHRERGRLVAQSRRVQHGLHALSLVDRVIEQAHSEALDLLAQPAPIEHRVEGTRRALGADCVVARGSLPQASQQRSKRALF